MPIDRDKPLVDILDEPLAEAVVEDKDSVEITMNAKGELAFKVKAYAPTLTEAINKAQTAAVEMRLFREGEIEKDKAGD